MKQLELGTTVIHRYQRKLRGIFVHHISDSDWGYVLSDGQIWSMPIYNLLIERGPTPGSIERVNAARDILVLPNLRDLTKLST
jgi:hypothetical protein